MTLIEVGPRFCLNPIKIFSGSFTGQTLYENPFYVSPNQVRAAEKRKKAGKYAKKIKAKQRRKMHELSNQLEPDEFADMWNEWICCFFNFRKNNNRYYNFVIQIRAE